MKNLTQRNKQKRIIFIILSFAISLTALILIILNFRDNIVFFYSPSELKDEKIVAKISGTVIRVGGLVKEGTVYFDEDNNLNFTITDLENDLKISFSGIKPDLFREGQGMVAKGKFSNIDDIFLADELLAKHDENYMPVEVKNSLKGDVVSY